MAFEVVSRLKNAYLKKKFGIRCEIRRTAFELKYFLFTGSPKCLGNFLECNGDSLGRYWSCKAHANLKVVNHKDPSKSLERSISHLFYFKQNEYGYKVEGKIDKFWDFKLNIYPTNVVGSSSIWTYQILKMYLLLFSPGRCT